jgi:hypothetical protein
LLYQYKSANTDAEGAARSASHVLLSRLRAVGRRAIHSRQGLASTSFFSFLRARASCALEWALTAAPPLAVGRRAIYIYSRSLLAAAGAAGCIAYADVC